MTTKKERDISSYFNKSPRVSENLKPKPKRPVAAISSDEDDSNAKSSNKSKKVGKISTRLAILSDSEDEGPVFKKVASKQEKKESPKNEQLKPVVVTSIFGKERIKRVKAPSVVRKVQKEEAKFHDEKGFDDTLIQLDTSQIEKEYLQSISKEKTNGHGKRKLTETDEHTEGKKIRKIENKNSDGGHEASKKNEEKSTRVEISPKNPTENKNETENAELSKKLHLNKLKKGKANIVFEKHDDKQKEKKARQADDVDYCAELIEKKKARNAAYEQYKQRGGARNPGSKPIPEGADYCLSGLTFVLTGVFDSLERDEAAALIQKYGGKSSTSISKKTNYIVVGDSAGASKLEKAEKLGTKQISEDDLLDLIRTRPAGKPVIGTNASTSASRTRKASRSPDKEERNPKKSPINKLSDSSKKIQESFEKSSEKPKTVVSQEEKPSTSLAVQIPTTKGINVGQALVDKYRPKNIKQIIGQYGEKSNANKLYIWLSNWHKNQNGPTKPARPGLYAKNDNGAFFKACLLSGPPGIGKTTTAQVVCGALGFDLLEFNASDTRSKRLLKEEVSGILSNTTVKGYFTENPSAITEKSKQKRQVNHVLLMDEVDGMAGNEDRGGLQELITLIKSSEVPIICICNDRNHPKMRTLSNYTFDLRFTKPRIEQIKGAMKSLCCKENIDISSEDLDCLIKSTNHDIRQVINHLAMLTGGPSTEEKSKQANKDLRLGPWDVIRKVFSAEEHKTMNIHDKSALFFHDYNIAPLFVQENYLSVVPKAPKTETMERIAQAAESLAMGDVVDNLIRGSGAWSLLPTQACFSSVIPGAVMSGTMTGVANFPSWLGRNSTRGKFDRMLQQITVHTRLVTHASKEAINIDYLKHLRDAVVRPLVIDKNEGVERALGAMHHYNLLREDMESLVEVSLWPNQRDPLQSIESKVKAAFTRAYNKSSAQLPYLTNAAAPKKKANQASQDEGFMEGDEDDIASGSDNDDVDTDKMIKAKKPAATSKPTTSKAGKSTKTESKPASKRGRGLGKAK